MKPTKRVMLAGIPVTLYQRGLADSLMHAANLNWLRAALCLVVE